MNLVLVVGAAVLGVLAVAGAAGFLIERSADRHDRPFPNHP